MGLLVVFIGSSHVLGWEFGLFFLRILGIFGRYGVEEGSDGFFSFRWFFWGS